MSGKFVRIIALGLALGTAMALPAAVVEKIAIKVNDEIITLFEINQREQEARVEIQRSQRAWPADLRQYAIDQLVNDRLVAQLAKKEGVLVTRVEIEERINRLLKGRGMNLDDFKAALVQEGSNYDAFYEQTKQRITMQKLFNKSPIAKNLTPGDAEIEAFYRKAAPQEYHVLHCYVSLPVNASFAVRNAKERVIKNIETAVAANPWGFAGIAAANAEMWKDFGFILPGPDMPKYTYPAFSLQPGQTRSFRVVNEIPGFPGFHLVFLAGKRPVALNAVRDRISSMVYEEKLNAALEDWVKTLRKDALVIVMP